MTRSLLPASTLLLVLAYAAIAAAQSPPFVCGDADRSGTVTVSDGVAALRNAAGLGGLCAVSDRVCDVDRDRSVGVTDAVRILRFAAGLPTTMRCESQVAGDETVRRWRVQFPGCESVTAEAHYCLTFASDFDSESTTLALVGLDSGHLCKVQARLPDFTFADEVSSLGWRGEILYFCSQQGLVRLSLRDSSAELLSRSCEGATANDTAVFLRRSWADSFGGPNGSPWDVLAYASYDALVASDFEGVYELPTTSRIAASRDRLYGAWHSTDTVEVIDLATGTRLAPIHLEGYDDWVNGIAVTEDGLLVIDRFDAPPGSPITIFDATTGARMREVATDGNVLLNGLACIAGSDPAPP